MRPIISRKQRVVTNLSGWMSHGISYHESCSPGLCPAPHAKSFPEYGWGYTPLLSWHNWLENEPFEDVYYWLLRPTILVYWNWSTFVFDAKKQHNLHLVNLHHGPRIASVARWDWWRCPPCHPDVEPLRVMANDPWTAPALKSNISPEHQWLEDVFPAEIVPF